MPVPLDRRTLHFETYRDIADEISSLRANAYRPLGQWSLGQTCGHLAYYFRGSLEGFGFSLPWVVRVLFGRPFVNRAMRTGVMKPGLRTVPDSLISTERSDAAEDALLEDCLLWLERLSENEEPLHVSPLAGKLTNEEWRRLHCVHAAHHLGFLVPLDAGAMNAEETLPS